MPKIFTLTLFLVLAFSPAILIAAEYREYRPGGDEWSGTWDRFYAGDHEPELDDPLIAAGKEMTLVICEAISNRDMRLRRYAISAVGWIGDIRAIPTLVDIATSNEERSYFRGDALQAIYLLDRALAKKLAHRYAGDDSYLSEVAKEIENDSPSLVRPTTH